MMRDGAAARWHPDRSAARVKERGNAAIHHSQGKARNEWACWVILRESIDRPDADVP